MLFLDGDVGEPIGYVFCVFPLVEFCLRPDFRVYTVENLLADFTDFAFCGINKAAGPHPTVHTPQLTESPQEQAKKYHLV